jgi:tetratricopeptide (TPR) repeat protein/tRNA A-37 threonylcarbamoyl transferase component Bud32
VSPVCRVCGTQLPPQAARCPACQQPVSSVSSSAPTLPPEAPDQPPSPGAGRTTPDPAAATRIAGIDTAPLPADPAQTGPLAPGQSFGRRYHIKRLLGIGGMGAVYQAWDVELGVDVAIKLIRPEILSNPALAAEIQRRFKRELLLARRVSHVNVVRIHDLGEIDGIKYITMSYVDGTDLASTLAGSGPLSVPRALRITRGICAGLVAAHTAGVVHRDLKPANVMVGSHDETLVTDFGIARLVSEPLESAEARADIAPRAMPSLDPRYAGLTRMGSLLGTVEYMAPEQARGEVVDQRADIYALGLMLSEMLGIRPAAAAQGQNATAPAALPPVPAAVAAIIARCIEPDPAQRFQTSAALAQALAELDDQGQPLPRRRTVGLKAVVVAAVGALLLAAGAWWQFRPRAPAPAHAPLGIVIADFSNATADPTLDHTLEPVLKLSLEEASFISAYARGDVQHLGLTPPEQFDARTASELAVHQGLGAVITSRIDRDGQRYRLTATCTQPVTGQITCRAAATASSKGAVLRAVRELAEAVRKSLGDASTETERRFARDTLSASSLDVVHEYASAMESLSSGEFELARRHFADALARDDKFGLAYSGLAIAEENLGDLQQARGYATQALRHLDNMTERERFRARGLYYFVTGDDPSCIKEYDALVAHYPSDTGGLNNLALCLSRMRQWPKAMEVMRKVVTILPNRALYRVNLALYAAYSGDFNTAVTEAEQARSMSPFGLVPLGFAQVGLGHLDAARAIYTEFSKASALGASYAASGFGDLAAYTGHYAEAARVLKQGAADDMARNASDRAAAKYAALAAVELARARPAAAVEAAQRALSLSQILRIRFLAGRVLAQAGAPAAATGIAKALEQELPAESRAHGKLVEGEVALAGGDVPRAVALFEESIGLLDTWIGRFELGRAYLAAGALPQADSEFDRCSTRRGEALALFLDEEPTYALAAPLDYYQGRVREGLGDANFAEAYQRYLALRGEAGEDPLLEEVRRRAAAHLGEAAPTPAARP